MGGSVGLMSSFGKWDLWFRPCSLVLSNVLVWVVETNFLLLGDLRRKGARFQ